MKNEFQIPLSKKKMKHMFADYLRNKLNPEEKSLFESSLSYYPEIQSELSEIRKLFHLIDNSDFEDIIQQRTKNLSVKINQRLEFKEQSTYINAIYKKIIPALLVVVLIIVISFFIFQNNNSNNETISKNHKILNSDLNSEDISVIIDYAQDTDFVTKNLNYQQEQLISLPEDKIIDDQLENMYNQVIVDNFVEYFEHDESLTNLNIKSEFDLINIITELNNEDFEILEKELKNAKI